MFILTMMIDKHVALVFEITRYFDLFSELTNTCSAIVVKP